MRRPHIRSRAAIVAVGLSATLLLAACGGSSDSGSTSDASASDLLDIGTPVTISQSYIPAVTNLLPILASDYASKFNLTIKSEKAQNVQSLITSAVRGDIDVFPGTPAGVLVGRDSGLPLTMLASGATGSTQLLIAEDLGVKPGDWTALKTLVDTRKKAHKPLKFGSAVAGSANFVECQQSMAKKGIEVGTDVGLVTLQNFADQPSALGQGEVQILCTPEPFATSAINAGNGIFFDTPYDSASGDVLGAITTTENTLKDKTKRTALARYLATLQYAADQIAKDPQIAIRRVMELATVDEKSAKRMLTYTKYTLEVSESNIKAMASVMKELGQTSKDLSGQVPSFINTSLLPDKTGLKPQ